MDKKILYEEITALIDNEISETRSKELDLLLKKDSDLQLEFNIQNGVKKLLKNRFASKKAPKHLYNAIMSDILNSDSSHK